MKIFGVQINEVDNWWPFIATHVDNIVARSNGRYSPHDLKEDFRRGDKQAWVIHEANEVAALVVTQINCYPQKTALNYFAVTGKGMKDWVGFSEIINAWGKDNGCDLVETNARPGWEKVMPWRKTHVFLEADI